LQAYLKEKSEYLSQLDEVPIAEVEYDSMVGH
jgi:hypothetical protein